MNLSEAKKFIQRAVADQAAQDGVQISKLELDMLNFSEESGDQRMLALVEKFDAEYESDTYEKKVTQLLRRSYDTARGALGPDAWREALSAFEGHDVYVMVMIEQAGIRSCGIGLSTQVRPPYDRLKLFLTGITIVATILLSQFVWLHWGEPAMNRINSPSLFIQSMPAIVFFGLVAAFVVIQSWIWNRRNKRRS
jgi:hypothetical protein